MQVRQRGLFVVLVITGVYMLVFHADPLPANHEDIGLGSVHALHDIIGFALLGTAGLVWWRSKRTVRAEMPGAPPSGSA